MRTVSVVTSFVLIAAGTGLSAAPAMAATSITCGATVTGDVQLDRNLTCTGNGVTVTGDATVDLGGYQFRGPGTGTPSVGITVIGPGDITVLNGRLSSWRTAVAPADDESDLSESSLGIDQVTFADNGTGLDASGFRFDDSSSRDVKVQRSRFSGNGRGLESNYGQADVQTSVFSGNTTALSFNTSTGRVRDIRVTGNDIGFDCYEASCRVAGSVLLNNGTAITTRRGGTTVTDTTISGSNVGYTSFDEWDGTSTLTGNRFTRNTTAVLGRFGSWIIATDNTFTRNETAVTSESTSPEENTRVALTGNRFTGNGDAIYLLIDSALRDNAAHDNTGWGIYAPHATDLGGNSATGNGNQPQCTGVACP